MGAKILIEYFDTHVHYDDEKFDLDRNDVIKKIYSSGVTKCINVGCNVETSKKSIEIARKNEFIYAMCGIHPSEIPQTDEELWKTIAQIKDLATSSLKVIAIGEIGLDYHWRNDNKEIQIQGFKAQIDLANELNLPVTIHTRDAIDDTINIIRSVSFKKNAVLHCCPFNYELVRHGLDKGLYIAFGGTSTFKNSKNANEIVNMVPLDKMLIETDSPYLSPEPFRGTRNDSSNLKYIVQKLADYKNISLDQMAKITYCNAERLYFGA